MRKNKKNKLLKKINKSLVYIKKFLNFTTINFFTMKKNLKKIWASAITLLIITTATSCNVTRTIKTESSYFQKGDTTCTITVKTVETYDATKKGI